MAITPLNKAFFRTTDLSLAGALQLHNYPIERMDRDNPRKIAFLFREDQALEALIEQYWARKLLVEPLAYFESLKSIKARIYQ